ncbi:glucans biosynthesis glucosyltransferase MdoH [Spirochaeta cellobiosiphila]|uniref:glucans biosynthesis glucosyltransferase MdoH n=1 Tax=Spirochaeta cellobiosiphila TaxID=504483 RepID=UPI0003F569D6|nr:glucans biosynthesis glucosyltransferase MdoH [Spirochaeta cellobiosiphila]
MLENFTYMPTLNRLKMETQSLNISPPSIRKRNLSLTTTLYRALLVFLTLVIIGIGVFYYGKALYILDFTLIKGISLALFTLNLAWIGLSCATSLIGFLSCHGIKHWKEASLGSSKTAIVMPIYNEDISDSFSSLYVMAEELIEKGLTSYFEICILSDSSDPDCISRERAVFSNMKDRLEEIPIWYRHRKDNIGKKVGNIADFVQNWGGHYDYFLVLDADSLMKAESLVTLVRRMEGDANIGLIQTIPNLMGSSSLYARLQQFASQVYGKINALGIASWSGDSGNYWGHNAIIRMVAFAESCGLPVLSGQAPWGGHILSHDFVEAAFLRRRSWKIYIAPDIDGSWEDSPPSLIESSIRDRRWMQGNLQHIKVITTKGLRSFSRLHFMIGIMGYLSSIIWFAMIGFGIATYSYESQAIVYNSYLIKTFVFTMTILLTPKILGLSYSLLNKDLDTNRRHPFFLVISFILELCISILLSPTQMLLTLKSFIEILRGKDSGWKPQNRAINQISWLDAYFFHRSPLLIALCLATYLTLYATTVVIWFLPLLVGLLLGAPLNKFTSSRRIGQFCHKINLFDISEEINPDKIITDKLIIKSRINEIHPFIREETDCAMYQYSS